MNEIYWEGYGFSFKRIRKPNGEYTLWVRILDYLNFTRKCAPSRRSVILKMVDPEGYNACPQKARRGWQSNVFSALRKEGYIHYHNKFWYITEKGIAKLKEAKRALSNGKTTL